MYRKILSIVLLLFFALQMQAQTLEPITWETSVENNSDTEATLRFAAKIQKGWHLYGFDLPAPMPLLSHWIFLKELSQRGIL